MGETEEDLVATLESRVATLEQLLESTQDEAESRGNELETEKKNLQEILSRLPAVVAVYSGPEHRIEFANAQFGGVASGREFWGRPLQEVFPELAEQTYGGTSYLDLLDRTFRTGEPFFATEALVELFDSTGSLKKIFFNFALIPIADASGHTTRVLAHAVDVTDQVLSRHEAEALATDLGQLAEASLAINGALSIEAVLQEAADAARAIIGCRRAVARMHAEDLDEPIVARQSLSDDFKAWHAQDRFEDLPSPAIAVARSKQPLRLDLGALKTFPGAEALWDPAEGIPPLSNWLGVPLFDRDGSVIGTLAVSSKLNGEFTESDEHALVQLAQLAAVAAVNATLYESAQSTAETLQLSLLPAQLPDSPDLEIQARYLPSTAGTYVGGDWYDAFCLPDGKMGLVVGDVAGKGIKAAALMGQLRVALQAYALDGHPPGGVVQRLNRLAQEMNHETMVTLVYLVLDIPARVLTYVSAGHPPPLLLEGENARLLEPNSVPIGVTSFAEFEEHSIPYQPGSRLILYSDGLIERRGESLQQGLERLRQAALYESGLDVADLCDALLQQMEAASSTDDVALMVVGSLPATSERMEMRITARPQRAADVRRALGRWLDQINTPAQESFELTVALGEAVANAIEHAYFSPDGTILIEAHHDRGNITLCVQDYGRWRQSTTPTRGRGLELIRSLCDRVDIRRSSTGTRVEMTKMLAGAESR